MPAVNKRPESDTLSSVLLGITFWGLVRDKRRMALTEDMILTRSKLMTAPGETLKEILELFGQQPKSTDRVKLVMEADKLFLAEMDGELAGTSLMAFQHSLSKKEASTVKTEKVDDKTASVNIDSV